MATEPKGRTPQDAENAPDKTGARDPNLPPEEQGVTQDEANRRGDISGPENQAELSRQRMETLVPKMGENPAAIGEHDPPEAAEHGGAETDPAASGHVDGESQRRMGQAASRGDRSGKPKG